jgi:hypothetical protein
MINEYIIMVSLVGLFRVDKAIYQIVVVFKFP